jgi:hypothetical protein
MKTMTKKKPPFRIPERLDYLKQHRAANWPLACTAKTKTASR